MIDIIFKLRSRILLIMIFGLISLSFYANYYSCNYSAVRELAILTTESQSPVMVARLISNESGSREVQGSAPLKKTTSEYLNLYNTSKYSLVTTFSTSVSSQSSPSSHVSVESVEQPIVKQLTRSRYVGENKATVIRSDSVAAVYEAGHTVAIPEKCFDFGAGLEIVILVMSAPGNSEARTAIRRTWGSFDQRKDVSIAFLVGRTSDAEIEKVLLREQDLYEDVIRGNFVDSYSNLTLKAISLLEWVCDYCSRAKFVLKTDDDMFINVPRLLSFVNKHSEDRNIIFGRLGSQWKPIRNKKSKYYVSWAQYKRTVFPDFTTGPAYLLSGDVVAKLYDTSLTQTYFKLEDVFTTGIVAEKLGIKRTHAKEFLNERPVFNPCNVQRVISIHMVNYSEQFDLWAKLLDGRTKCRL